MGLKINYSSIEQTYTLKHNSMLYKENLIFFFLFFFYLHVHDVHIGSKKKSFFLFPFFFFFFFIGRFNTANEYANSLGDTFQSASR